MENLFDALTGLICTGLMIFTVEFVADVVASIAFFLCAVFFFFAVTEGRDE